MAEFVDFANSCEGAAERQAARSARITNVDAALILHNRQSELEREQKTLTISENMFLQSIGDRPRAYRSKLQKAWYEGPNARRDAEDSERTRWLGSLADIVANSPTPMGKLLCSQPGNLELLGGGRRASTLRSRVRELKKFFTWFSVTYEEEFTTTEEHFTGFLRVRASEPCNRGALKATHRSFSFLEEVTGMPLNERKTKVEALRCHPSGTTEHSLVGKTSEASSKIPSQGSQSSRKLRYGRHEASTHAHVCVVGIVADLVYPTLLRPQRHQPENSPRKCRFRVNVPGKVKDDRPGQNRPDATFVPRRCVFRTPIGSGLGGDSSVSLRLRTETSFYRVQRQDCTGCTKVEIRYDRGLPSKADFLRNSRTPLSSSSIFIPHPVVHFWTPHSSRTFMHSSSSALGFTKSTETLGGWTAENSDRYARVARLKIQTMQKAVVAVVFNPSVRRPSWRG